METKHALLILFSAERKEHEHTTNIKVSNALVDDGFDLWWIALFENQAMKEKLYA